MSIIRTFIYDVAMVSPRYREQDECANLPQLVEDLCLSGFFHSLVEDFFRGTSTSNRIVLHSGQMFQKVHLHLAVCALNHDSMPHKKPLPYLLDASIVSMSCPNSPIKSVTFQY